MGNDSENKDLSIRLKVAQAPCLTCHLRSRCVISAIPLHHLDNVREHVRTLKPVERGDTIYRAGEPAHRLLIVHAGSARTSMAWSGGREIICDYHLSGDSLGLDGFYAGIQATTSVALETTQLCELRHESLYRLAAAYPELRERICLQTSRALIRSQRHQLEISVKAVEQRLASFLLALSARLTERGYSAHDFYLPLSRQEIANHLAMRTETLSRLLTTFRQRGLIAVDGRAVQLLQLGRLRTLSND